MIVRDLTGLKGRLIYVEGTHALVEWDCGHRSFIRVKFLRCLVDQKVTK